MFKNSINAYRIYRRLTDEEKEILQDRKVSGKYTIREWNKKLSHIALMDSYADKARQGLVLVMVSMAFPLFILIILMINGVVFAFFLAFLLVLLFGTALWLHLKFKKLDVGNQLRFFVIPSLKLLSSKVRKSHKVELDINLGIPTDEQYQSSQEVDDRPANKRYQKITTTFFRLSWLTAKVPLADGALLIWENEDIVRERRGVKYHKNKRKTKYKNKHLLKAKLVLPKAKYQLAEDVSEGVSIEETEKFYMISLKGKQLSKYHPNLHGDYFKSMSPKYFTSLLISAYKQVEPIQPLAS
ncbi:hypothetical protein OKW21_000363 [Catalinimonas alkaloidigena]|uniref:hypothetical protein n=1 Tax=Catalinimonas alkaloidigena TaxID=1075417 RepID=UPI0024054FC8|nr:hypothetical protein [Catalinimonas alkaloidigena]MDF9795100.1 hypothetical protein [Catalinimonas alkaloidigena]